MKINVLLSPYNVDELYFSGKTIVVIDVLRAASVIPAALANGAREVIPVDSVEFAMKVSGNAFGGQTLLGGERNTKIIDGFSLGNSPLEYTREAVSGKSIILFTTNGSRAIVRAKFAEMLFTASFNNISAVARFLSDYGSDVEILCAGSNGAYCIEDTACAGKLITLIEERRGEIILSDAAESSKVIFNHFGKNIEEMLLNCEHGKKLIENGFEMDIRHCAKLDIYPILPFFDSGEIKIYSPPKEDEIL